MAAPTGGGIPLEEYRKDVPPGWAPNIPSYPLKLYLERLRLWYRLYDGMDETVGPLIAGRLQGRAQSIALNLRLPDPHGGIDVGDAALVRLSVDQVHDPNTGQVIQQAIPSGVQKLLMELRAAFGEADQLQATKALETFFELRRGRSSIQEWAVDWQMKLDEAIEHAGLDLNNVAKTYLFFKSSGLPQKYVDDILLQLHGDLRRFDEARTLLLRMAHRTSGHADGGHSMHYGGESQGIEQEYETSWHYPWKDSGSHHDYWETDDSSWYWSRYDNQDVYPTYDYYEDTSYDYDTWDDDYLEDDWETYWEDYEENSKTVLDPVPGTDSEEFYGKGKGGHGSMGLGCTICGSKWHSSSSCPMSQYDSHKGKGKDKGKSSGKGGFSRPKGSKGFGKSKGKGKGKSRKGFGKSKGKFGWYADLTDQAYDVNSYAARRERQLRHAQTGLPAVESAHLLTTSFGEVTEHPIHTPRARQDPIIVNSPHDYAKDFAHKPMSESSASTQHVPDPTAKVSKHLSFPAWETESSEAYHMVRGQRVCGLLVDPGASAGLIGSDTLKEMFDLGVVPEELQSSLEFGPSQTKVTGISGVSDDTLARVTIPFFADQETSATFSADILAQAGSTCPALLPNVSLRQLRTVLLTQWCDNGDGYMVCSLNGLKVTDPQAHLVVLKLLLAESGHYILPVRREDQRVTPEEKRMILALFRQEAQTSGTLEQTVEISPGETTSPLQFAADHVVQEPSGESSSLLRDDDRYQILASSEEDSWYDDDAVLRYEQDYFPDHLPDHKLKYLHQMYKAIPEEFYTKTKRRPVTPCNVRAWLKGRQSRVRYNFWEWCSGSGRLTLLMLLGGLSVLFPVDYRYGWDIGHPPHQALLLEVTQALGEPDQLFCAPSCRAWSISSTKRDLQQTHRERQAELPGISFMKDRFHAQVRAGKDAVVENPWSSALWDHFQDVPGYSHRCDQCQYGAADETGDPILKPTGFRSTMPLRSSTKRCHGHQGRRHGWLQGSWQGKNRTTTAAVYPERLCKALAKDLRDLLHRRERQYHQDSVNYYECPRCQMGRSSPPGTEHSLIPGQCRYGKWPDGMHPRDLARKTKAEAAKENVLEHFRQNALRSDKISKAKLALPSSFSFDSEGPTILKFIFATLLQESIDHFDYLEKAKASHDYVHWLEDPTALHWAKKILSDYLQVGGVVAHLQPWAKPLPTPVFTTEQCPLRCLVIGSLEAWRLHEVEDLRELSLGQWHEPIDVDEAWLIAFFGAPPGSEPASSSSPEAPAQRANAVPPGSRPPEKSGEEDARGREPAPARNSDADERAEAEPVEEETLAKPGSIKPVYDFRRIFAKLPKMALADVDKMKRLLLGLHERLWHASFLDFKNILVRCGMPYEVWKHAADVVASCLICRKHARAHRRPQDRGAHLPHEFNDTIQVDPFHIDQQWYLLIVDEATRYKIGTLVKGRDHVSLLSGLLRSWIRYFGPPRNMISDQETSLMSVEAGTELERLHMQRQPRGTTSGKQGAQHTGTGLVERHIELTKITMAKIHAEALRYGIEVEGEELIAEACMAQNTTVSYGGYTPSMAVFGILPRGYMDPEEVPLGADTEAISAAPFERAARLRQIALQAAQAAILESRIVRAGRTRPQRTPVENLVPGTSQVELFRDDGTGQGWRGPGTLLKLDEDAGTAVVDYQNKPYLLPLRMVRPFRGTFLVYFEQDMRSRPYESLRKIVEESTPFRIHTVGKRYQKGKEPATGKWLYLPPTPNARSTQMLEDAQAFLAEHYPHGITLSGILFGRGLKAVLPPQFTRGVLMGWLENHHAFYIVENLSDQNMKLRNPQTVSSEDMCILYFYWYLVTAHEELATTASQPSRAPMEVTTRSLSTPQGSEDSARMEVVETPKDLKRDPSTAPTLGDEPGGKRSRHLFNDHIDINLRSLHWMMQRPRKCRFERHDVWTDPNEWEGVRTKNTALAKEYYTDLRTDENFKVDEDTATLTEEQVLKNWAPFEESDRNELRQFIEQKVFNKVRLQDVPPEAVIVDATWVRKWKRQPSGALKAKSRMCARGFLDQQKRELPTRSTTATRLSQRILVSLAVNHDFELVSWDVAGAFLKGFSFDRVRRMLQEKGISIPKRTVIVIPPANVWRHFASMDPSFAIEEEELGHVGLLCQKPCYGLNDAPLAWQLCLHAALKEAGGAQSVLDDCFWFWKDTKGQLLAVLTTHVDDLGVAGTKKLLEQIFALLTQKFGKIAVQELPFVHCGTRYSRIPQGIKMDQEDFAMNLKTVEVDPSLADDKPLSPAEVTSLRSVLGGLLWLTSSRPDLIADVGVLQSRVHKATVSDLRTANGVVKKAKDKRFVQLGIVYKKLPLERGMRLVCIHDASAASKNRNYSQDGILILLMSDTLSFRPEVHTLSGNDTHEAIYGGRAHILWCHGAKAKRISYSTSHAETLAAISGLETASLVNLRLSEIQMTAKQPTLQMLAAVQESPVIPVDCMTDCRDLWELTCGTKTLPQDRSQRIYILAHREARLAGRLRWLIWVPTASMTADAFTKVMVSPALLLLLSSGIVHFRNEDKHVIQARRLPPREIIDEDDLLVGDDGHLKGYISTTQLLYVQRAHRHHPWIPPQRSHGHRPYMQPWLYFAILATCFVKTMSLSTCSLDEPTQESQGDARASDKLLLIKLVLVLLLIVTSGLAGGILGLRSKLNTCEALLDRQLSEALQFLRGYVEGARQNLRDELHDSLRRRQERSHDDGSSSRSVRPRTKANRLQDLSRDRRHECSDHGPGSDSPSYAPRSCIHKRI